MPLNVAVQMDPMEGIKIGGDSTFALMLSAQARGHRMWHYEAPALTMRDGRLLAKARPVTVQRVEGDHFSFGDWVDIDLGRDVDVVLMRQDPPFDLGYITVSPELRVEVSSRIKEEWFNGKAYYRLHGELLGAIKVPPLTASDTETIARLILDERLRSTAYFRPVRIAHLSDLHLGPMPRVSPRALMWAVRRRPKDKGHPFD